MFPLLPFFRPVRTEDKIDEVGQIFDQNPHLSTRRAANAIQGISRRSIQRVLKQDLHMFPYKLQRVQRLTNSDHQRRVAFAQQQLQRMAEDHLFLGNLMFTDEAHFCLHGGVNRQNYRFWSDANPHWFTEIPLHSPHVTVWIGIGQSGIVGPFFFNETVNSERYLAMLENSVLPALQEFPNYDALIFMHDGAPPHWAITVRNFLDANFPMRWMGRGSQQYPWPARSPDLTPCDFFLWGYLKSLLYTDVQFPNLQALQDRISQVVQAVPQEMINGAISHFARRLTKCVARGGRSTETV